VIDIAATVLDCAGLPEPTRVHGVDQVPIQGRTMRPTFDDGSAPEFRETQYFEMFVNRGIYHEGWTAVTRHSTPWVMAPLPPIDDDVWELYGPDDWSQSHDLAAEQPERLAQLKELFLEEARRNQVLPLDDRRVERFDAAIAGRPSLVHGTSQLLFGGMGRLSENSVLNIKNKSHAITAQFVVHEGTTPHGVLIAQGGAFGGWTLYLIQGVPVYCYNLFGLQRFKVRGGKTIGSGEHQLRVEFAYDGGGLAKGGTATLFVDGEKVGEGRVEQTQPLAFSADETTDIGTDAATPVSDDYGSHDSAFNGRVRWVQIDLGDDAQDADHLISPEERLRVAMARQ
jgi:arylsulfatase